MNIKGKYKFFISISIIIMMMINFTSTAISSEYKVSNKSLTAKLEYDIEHKEDTDDRENITNETDDKNVVNSTDKSVVFSSSDKPGEGYKVKESQYIKGNGVKSLRNDKNQKRVLLIQDNLPWNTNSNAEVLSGITEYDLVSTSEFLTVDLSLYAVVVFANDQSFDMYENYKTFKEYLEKFASLGGVIVFGACDGGWAEGELTEELPGGVTKSDYQSYRNYISDSTHPIVTGELTDKDVLKDEDLYENFVSHIYFNDSSLPVGSKTILKNENGLPTLVEYPLGEGRVIASGLTWEFNYVHGGESHPLGGTRGYYAKKAMDDLFTYAIRVSKIDVEDVSKLNEYWTNKYAHSVYVAEDGTFNPIKDSEVTINGQVQKTDERGIADFKGIAGEYKVQVNAEGYKVKSMIYTVKANTIQTFYLQKLTGDKKPYITMASSDKSKGKDLTTQKIYFDSDSDEKCKIKLDGIWSGIEPGKYIIYQEGKSISDKDGNFEFEPGKIFSSGKKIYAVMVGADGETKSEKIELGIIINETSKFEVDTQEDFKLLKEIGFTVKDGLPIIGGTTFNASLDFIPATIFVDDNKVKIAIGITDLGKVKDSWDSFKEDIEEIDDTIDRVNNLKKMVSKYGAKSGAFTLKRGWEKPELNVTGYGEGEFDEFGNITNVKGYIVADSELKYSYNQQFVVGPVPCYFEIGGGAKFEYEGGFQKVLVEAKNFELNSKITITPGFTIGGGVGINGALSVGAEGNAELPIETDFVNDHISVSLTGGMKLKASLLYVFKAETPEIKGTWSILDKFYNQNKLPGDQPSQVYKMSNFQKLERNYIGLKDSVRSYSLNEGENMKTLKSNLLPTSTPKVCKVGDKIVMVYQTDDESRDENNRTKLVYSVYDNGSWSKPVAVWDNGAPDFAASIESFNDELYVVWQKASRKLSNDSGDMDKQINEALSLSEIAYSKFDSNTNSFVDMQYLTSDDKLDMSPTLTADKDNIYISWVNSSSDIFEKNIENKIVSVSKTADGSWSDKVVIKEVNSNIVNMDSSIINGKINVAYAVDGDGDINTYDDIEMYMGNKDNVVRVTNNRVGDITPYFYGDKLYWYSDKKLMSYGINTKEVEEEIAADMTQDYRIINYGKNEAVIWLDSVAEDNNSIKASIKQGDKWSKPVDVFKSEEIINFYDGCIDNSGKWNMVMNLKSVDGQGESNNLVNYVDSFKSETKLVGADCTDKKRSGSIQDVTVGIENTGHKDVSNVIVSVYNKGDMSLISEKTVSCEIPVGETVYFDEQIDVGEVVSKKDLVITVKTSDEDDDSNNSKDVTIGYTDVKLGINKYEIGNEIIIEATVSNESDIPTNAAISIIEDKEDGIVLDMKNIGMLSNESSYVYRYSISKDKINFNDARYKSYFVKIDCNKEERIISNNLEWIVIDSKELQDFDGEPAPEDLIINVTGVSISPSKDITLNLKGEKVYELEAKVYPENATNKSVVWTSSDNNVVTVSNDGKLQAVGVGNAKITVMTKDGEFTDVCNVTVISEDINPGGPSEEEKDYALLKGLDTEGFELSPAFNQDILKYSSVVKNNVNKVVLIPALYENVKGVISINGNDEVDFNGRTEIPLIEGKNVILIKTIGDNLKESSYSIVIEREKNTSVDSGNNNNGSSPVQDNKLPSTGQYNYIWLVGMLMIISGVYISRRRKIKSTK